MAAMAQAIFTTEVWAQLWLCGEDCARIKDLLASAGIVRRSSILNRLHITVYHARRPMSGLMATEEQIALWVPTAETRFMVLAPGGENPRPELGKVFRAGIDVLRFDSFSIEIVRRERTLKSGIP